MLTRKLNISKKHSFFLFGARGTGKTALLNQLFSSQEAHRIDFLNSEIRDRFELNPSLLSTHINSLPTNIEWIVIDEVQKVPAILDIVQSEMIKKRFKFALTGSSARKLKRSGVNLLAGRARVFNLFPFTTAELKDLFNLTSNELDDILSFGGLPEAILEKDTAERKRFLKSYVQTYIQEEIVVEQLIRKLPPFKKFLAIAAQSNGTIVNFANVARDVGVAPVTVQSYYQILEDTLLGFWLEAFDFSVRKQQSKSPKFYLFDLGIQRALSGNLEIPLFPETYGYGRSFEHLIITEIMRLISYAENDYKISYLRTKDDLEIDLVIQRPGKSTILLEIKSATKIHAQDLNPLISISKDIPNSEAYCFSRDPIAQIIDGVHLVPWQKGFKEIGLDF